MSITLNNMEQVYRHLGPTVADLALPTTDSQVPTSQPEPGTT